MRHKRSDLLSPNRGDIGKEGMDETASELSERIPVEEQKGSRTVKPAKLSQHFQQRQRLFLEAFPFFAARFVTFRIRAVLSAPSFTESAVEVGDRCPVPVFEKTGSAL